MYKKRALLIGICVALVGAFFVFPLLVRALDWTTTFDGGDILTYTVISGTITASGNPGNGVDGGITTTGFCNTSISVAQVDVFLPSAMTVTLAELDSKGSGGGTGSWQIDLYDGSNAVVGTYTNSISLDTTWYTNGTGAISVASVVRVKFSQSACADTNLQVWIDNLSITAYTPGTPTATLTPTNTPDPSLLGWNKPLRGSDQRGDDVSFHPGRSYITELTGVGFKDAGTYLPSYNFNTGRSKATTVNLFAVVAGEVDTISAATCYYAPVGTPAGDCPLVWDSAASEVFYVDLRNVYVITESFDGGYVRYLVSNPVVQEGDTIQAGCLLGSTVSVVGYLGNYLSEGAAIVQGLDSAGTSTWDVSNKLVDEPSGIACAEAAARSYGNCQIVANSSFVPELGAWQPMYGVPGLSVVPYASPQGLTFPSDVFEVLNLDSAAQYVITFVYKIESGAPPQTLNIDLGTTQSAQSLTLLGFGQSVTHTIVAASYTADRADGLYTLRVSAENGQADQTTMLFICVDDSTTEPIADGESCLVLDPMFGQSYTNSPWTVSTEPPAVIPGGMVVVPDTGWIKQSLTLNPADGGGNFNYDLRVTYRRQGIASAGDDVHLDWEFGAQSGELTPAMTTQVWTDYTATFGVATDPVTADLTLTAAGSDGSQVAQISKVCVVSHDGGMPPGYRPPPPFQGGCRYCIYSPTGDVATDISELVQWLACQFFQLWECQLKILLGRIWVTIINILSFLGFFRIWLNATILGLATWGNGNILAFSRFIGGHLDNLGVTFQNSLTNLRSFTLITGSGAGFWDAIVAIANALQSIVGQLISGIGTPIIGLLQQIVTGLFGVIAGVFGLLGTLLSITFTFISVQANMLIGMITSIISALFTAFNTASVAVPPGAPTCETPGTLLYYPCLGFYVLDNTIFAGPVVYVFPIFMGIMAWRVLLWGVHRVKATFTG